EAQARDAGIGGVGEDGVGDRGIDAAGEQDLGRGIRPGESLAGSATCRWTSWRRPIRRSAPDTGCDAQLPSPSARIDPWPGTARLLPGSARPSGSRVFLLVDRLAERLDLRLERADPLHQLLERLGHRVGQGGLVQIDAVHPLAVLVCY